jgi:hypothetical protein
MTQARWEAVSRRGPLRNIAIRSIRQDFPYYYEAVQLG